MITPNPACGVVRVPLTKGYAALIDPCDAERVLAFRWEVKFSNGTTPYAYRAKCKAFPRVVALARFIVECPAGLEVDHINLQTLDNRRSNLRICTRAQNRMGKGLYRNNTTGWKGVVRRGDRFRVMVGNGTGRITHHGTYDTAEEASYVYDAVARVRFGEFAKLNHPLPGEQPARVGAIA